MNSNRIECHLSKNCLVRFLNQLHFHQRAGWPRKTEPAVCPQLALPWFEKVSSPNIFLWVLSCPWWPPPLAAHVHYHAFTDSLVIACLLCAKRWPRAPPPPPPPPPSLLIPRPPWLLRGTPTCSWPSFLSSLSGYDHQHHLHKGPAVSVWMVTSTGYHTYAATGWIYILDRNH